MKAEELRIGNLVTINNEMHFRVKGEIFKVYGINYIQPFEGCDYSISVEHYIKEKNKYYANYSQYLKFIEPIPLTEEWLLKFGFSIEGVDYFNKNLCSSFVRIGHGVIPVFVYCITDRPQLKFVHQLQNLFFSLTGEELILNPKLNHNDKTIGK